MISVLVLLPGLKRVSRWRCHNKSFGRTHTVSSYWKMSLWCGRGA